MQIFVFLSIVLMATTNPINHRFLMLVYAIMVSFSSATLDIVLDAYRVERFNEEPQNQAAAAAVFVLGYRFGLIFSGAGALWLAEYVSWNSVYFLMSLGSVVGFITIMLVKEPVTDFKYSVTNEKLINVRAWEVFLTKTQDNLNLIMKEQTSDKLKSRTTGL